MAGRKRKEIDGDKVRYLKDELKFNWRDIARDIDVSNSTLEEWRRQNYEQNNNNITEDELNRLAKTFLENDVRRGARSFQAYMWAIKGHHITQKKSRIVCARVDPEGTIFRRSTLTPHAVYDFYAPHLRWHIDGHHKLIRWGLVIHGCIDGGSHTIIYLGIADNNRSTIAVRFFKDGAERY